MEFAQADYVVNEGDGTVTVNLELQDVVEPTQAAVWVTLSTTNGALAVCKLFQT